MIIILMIITMLVVAYALPYVWLAIFWAASGLFFLVSLVLSKLGIYMCVSGYRMVWLLFVAVCGISYLVYGITDGGIYYAIAVFVSGNYMLFKSAHMWMVAE